MIMIIIPAITFFKYYEDEWLIKTKDEAGQEVIDYTSVIYYIFVTVATVGFGDFVPGKSPSPTGEPPEVHYAQLGFRYYFLATIPWMFFAIVLTNFYKDLFGNFLMERVIYPIANINYSRLYLES